LNGDVVGAVRETDVDFPSWGKWGVMRKQIMALLDDLSVELDEKSTSSVAALRDYILDAFGLDRIIQIKSRTKGSYLNLKDEKLKEFISLYKELKHESNKTGIKNKTV
jgi:hypothetical protein